MKRAITLVVPVTKQLYIWYLLVMYAYIRCFVGFLVFGVCKLQLL